MKEKMNLLDVPAELPKDATQFRFSREWVEGEGLGIPYRKIIPTASNMAENDFIIDFVIHNEAGKNWTMSASNWQLLAKLGKVEPYIVKDGTNYINPYIHLTFKKNSKGKVECTVKPLTEKQVETILK